MKYSFKLMNRIQVSFTAAISGSAEVAARNHEGEACSGESCGGADCGSGGGDCGPKKITVYALTDGTLESRRLGEDSEPRKMEAAYAVVELPVEDPDESEAGFRAYKTEGEFTEWLGTLPDDLRAQLSAN